MANDFRSARFWAQELIEKALFDGARAVDATMGNGHDTCFLAELVGEMGRVIGFDLQPDAVESSRKLLESKGLLVRCDLHCLGHEHMAEVVQGPVDAVMFNLGWLPGGDKRITTHWETTRQAVEAA